MLKSRHIISLNEKKEREKYLRISESPWWDSVTPRLLTENKKKMLSFVSVIKLEKSNTKAIQKKKKKKKKTLKVEHINKIIILYEKKIIIFISAIIIVYGNDFFSGRKFYMISNKRKCDNTYSNKISPHISRQSSIIPYILNSCS